MPEKNEIVLLNSEIDIPKSIAIKGNRNLLLQNIVEIFALACWVHAQNCKHPWEMDEKLSKRRSAYDIGYYIQCMAKNLNGVKTEYTDCIGNGGLYKTEIIYNNAHIHIHQHLTLDAKYIQSFFEMNENNSGEVYVYFQYELKNNDISELKLIYRNTKRVIEEVDLIDYYKQIKECLIRNGVNKEAKTIDEEYVRIQRNMLEETNKEVEDNEENH